MSGSLIIQKETAAMADNNPGPKTDKSAWKRTTLSWVGLIVVVVLIIFATVKLTVYQMPTTPLATTTTTTTSKEEAKAPTLSPKEKEEAEWKLKVQETLAKLVDRVTKEEEAKKAPSATDPQGGNALPPTGQEGYGQQGDPRTQQQPQGGYGGQQASPPVDPNVARFNQMAPTRHTRRGDVNFQLNNLKIPEAGLNDCERRGGQIVPGPGHYDRRGHYVGKNICSVGGGNSGH